MSRNAIFHLAFPVTGLEAARKFYVEVLGCNVGRESDRWIDFNFFGHQITAHLSASTQDNNTNPVDGRDVPVRHFGAILDWHDWHDFADRLKKANVEFVIEPHIRFAGQPGEQATLFIRDPSGNVLEFKSFQNPDQIFKS